MIYLFYLNGNDIVEFLEKNMVFYSRLAVLVSIVCAGALHIVSFLGGSVYFGLQNTVAFISLSYGLVYKRFFILSVSLLSIVLSGKRGGMLGALFMIFYFLFVKLFFYKSKYAFYSLMLGFFAGGMYIVFGKIPESIAHRFAQFSGSGPIDWNAATAGRIDEISSALSVIRENHYIGLWGMGHGAAIDINGAVDSTVHFSPLGLTMIVGSVFAVLIYAYFFCFVVKGVFVLSKKHGNEIYQVWFLVFLGEFLFSFTAFTLLQSYMLWLSLGVVVYYFSLNDSGGQRLKKSTDGRSL